MLSLKRLVKTRLSESRSKQYPGDTSAHEMAFLQQCNAIGTHQLSSLSVSNI